VDNYPVYHSAAVFLVDPRQTRQVAGRPKSDLHDCQWIRRLHACGLLAASFRPADEVCVLLMGTSLAPAGELAREIGDQRRKHRSGKLTLIPVDARDWDAHMPLDAPAIAKTLLARLKKGA